MATVDKQTNQTFYLEREEHDLDKLYEEAIDDQHHPVYQNPCPRHNTMVIDNNVMDADHVNRDNNIEDIPAAVQDEKAFYRSMLQEQKTLNKRLIEENSLLIKQMTRFNNDIGSKPSITSENSIQKILHTSSKSCDLNSMDQGYKEKRNDQNRDLKVLTNNFNSNNEQNKPGTPHAMSTTNLKTKNENISFDIQKTKIVKKRMIEYNIQPINNTTNTLNSIVKASLSVTPKKIKEMMLLQNHILLLEKTNNLLNEELNTCKQIDSYKTLRLKEIEIELKTMKNVNENLEKENQDLKNLINGQAEEANDTIKKFRELNRQLESKIQKYQKIVEKLVDELANLTSRKSPDHSCVSALPEKLSQSPQEKHVRAKSIHNSSPHSAKASKRIPNEMKENCNNQCSNIRKESNETAKRTINMQAVQSQLATLSQSNEYFSKTEKSESSDILSPLFGGLHGSKERLILGEKKDENILVVAPILDSLDHKQKILAKKKGLMKPKSSGSIKLLGLSKSKSNISLILEEYKIKSTRNTGLTIQLENKLNSNNNNADKIAIGCGSLKSNSRSISSVLKNQKILRANEHQQCL